MAVTKKKKLTLEQVIAEFEKKQQNLIRQTMAQIMLLFDNGVTEVAFLYAKRKLIGNRFLPKDIRQTIERISNTINAKTKDIIIRSLGQSFINSERKNDIIETQVANAGRRIPPGKRVKFISGTGGRKGTITAVDEFIKRKNNGLNLSQRVFKNTRHFKKVVNDNIIVGLKKGTAARELAKDLRRSLRNNQYTEHPGRGVYKSPQKNTLRLASTEINLAYANADFDRWQLIEAVIGIEIRLSAQHPKYDICDPMAGKYPKDFHFTKWHPFCLCIAIPILAPQEILNQIMDFKLGIIDKPPIIPYIKKLPESAIGWMEKNAERVKGWANHPYWLIANKRKIGKYFA